MGISEYISNQFSKPTGIGGKLSTFVMNVMNKKQYALIVNSIKDTKDQEKVLDIGFGNGKLLNKVSKNEKAEFYGIDISQDMLDSGLEKYPELKLQLGDITKSPFKDNYFNKIYTINTVYFWSDLDKGLSEVKRNLTDNGVFYNVFYSKKWLEGIKYTNYGFNRYTLEELKEKTKASGLEIEEVIEISKDKSYCIVAKKIN